jgi:hypothetical protein
LILSKKFRFVFIKGKRVGGTSVEIALSTICGSRDIITPIAPIDELQRIPIGGRARNYAAAREPEDAYIQQIQTSPRHALAQVSVPKERYYNHMPLREIIAVFGPSVSSFEIVCVERSPFAKILSWANWLASAEAYLSGGKLQTDLKALRCSVDRIFATGELASCRCCPRPRQASCRIAWIHANSSQKTNCAELTTSSATSSTRLAIRVCFK